MNYDPPTSMNVGDKIVIDVTIRRNGLKGNFLPSTSDAKTLYGLQGTGPMEGIQVPVADSMCVVLSSDNGAFDIHRKDGDAPVKGLSPGGHAEWHWNVTALIAGQESLTLHTQRAPYTATGQPLPVHDDGTYTTTINVSVQPKKPGYVVVAQGVNKFLSDNWEKIAWGILTTLGGGLIAMITKWWKKADNSPSPDDKH